MSPYTQSFFQKNNHSSGITRKFLNFKMFALIFALVIFGAIYILLFNSNIALSYKMDKLNSELKQIEDEGQSLTLKLFKAYNLINLKTIAEELNLEEIKSVNFLDIEDGHLVKR